MKQTAVEFLEEKLKGDKIFSLDVIITKAKEMENKQKGYSEDEVVNCIQYTLDNFFNGKLAGLNSKEMNSIRPNYKMVEKIHQKNLEKSRRYAEERKKLDVKSEPISVTTKTEIVKPKVEIKQKSFSLFWGLIKLNY